MKKRIALVLAAMMVVTAFLAGCTKAKDSGSGSTGTTTTTPEKPQDKQEITLNLGEEPPNLDSAKATDAVSFDVLNQTMEGLIRTGEGFKHLPGMAEKWDVNGVNYTFYLRKDAKWSDGKPVTSKDFKFAWLRALDPKTASEYNYQLFYIKGGEEFSKLALDDKDFEVKYKQLRDAVAIETPDDFTLKVTLKQETPYWLGLMAFPTYLPQREDIVNQFKDKYAAEAQNMVFNGPFTIESWSHDNEIILKKNPNYWDAKAVKLEKVTFKMIKDNNTAIQMYETGELDRTGVPGDFIPQYKDKGMQTLSDVTTWYLTFNLRNKTFQNANLRKAFNLALNRKGFADNVLKNGSVPAEGLIPGSMAGLDGQTFRKLSGSHLNQTANLDEAKKLWEQAKQELGITKLTVKLLGSDSTNGKKYAAGVQEMLQSALPGLTIEVDPVAFAVRLERTDSGDFDMVFQGWGADYNDPMTFMEMWTTTNSYNDAKWSNAKYDELIKKAQSSPDPKVRMTSMAEAEKILMTELPIMPLYHPAHNWVSRPYLKGVLDFPLGASIDLKNAYVEGRAK